MWVLFQLSIMAAVMCGNIYWKWTPNGYVVGILGLGAAYFATWILVRLRSLFGRRSAELEYQPSSERLRACGAHWDTAYGHERPPSVGIGDDPRKLIEIVPKRP
jgi:hypothetical protein